MPQRLRTTALVSVTAACAAIALVAATPASATKPGSGSATGSGSVFMVNPVQSSGIQSLTDQKDSDAAVPQSAYAVVPLRNLDGSGYLRGKWANVQSATGTPAYSTTNTFNYTRHQDQFEQVMGYFWVNQAQEYLQSLGFGSTLPGIVKQPFDVKIDQYGGDNSYQTDKPYRIRLGKGGVDDAEDAEVIVHEYGHAVHASQVPGYGTSLDAGSIGESFGDYLAVSVGLDAAGQYGWPVRAEQACPMDWDSTSYTAAPHCIRRFDTGMTVQTREGEVHADGQIWSQALWEIRLGYVAMHKTTRDWDTTLIDAQFRFAPGTSFSAAAKATYDTALARDGAAAAALVKARFAARGISF
ncbi:M36 family metallopeptidase [Pedococcus bigeumensis]|uniref:M36 family metallopeptidase n=1 Tax=Pedococcus bigeumensis TaxID=433644 RepID=UPI002FE8F5EE